MLPAGAVHFAASPGAYRVVQRDGEVRAGADQSVHDQAGYRQARLLDLPAGAGGQRRT